MIPIAIRSRMKRFGVPGALCALVIGLAGCSPGVLAIQAPPGSGQSVTGGGSTVPGALPTDHLTGVVYCGKTFAASTHTNCVGQVTGQAGGKPFSTSSGIGAFAQGPETCGKSSCLFKLGLIIGPGSWNGKSVVYELVSAQQLSGQGRGKAASVLAICAPVDATSVSRIATTTSCTPTGASSVVAPGPSL